MDMEVAFCGSDTSVGEKFLYCENVLPLLQEGHCEAVAQEMGR